jgi:hypothetical protein
MYLLGPILANVTNVQSGLQTNFELLRRSLKIHLIPVTTNSSITHHLDWIALYSSSQASKFCA